MTDQELLEKAAKAAGLNGYIHEWINGPEFIIPGSNPVTWNPLTDDGDALRLAVELKLDINNYEDYVHVWYQDFFSTGPEYFYGDPRKATRRAITRAAAAIADQ